MIRSPSSINQANLDKDQEKIPNNEVYWSVREEGVDELISCVT